MFVFALRQLSRLYSHDFFDQVLKTQKVFCHAKGRQASRFVRKKAHSEQEGLVLFLRDGHIQVAYNDKSWHIVHCSEEKETGER